MIFLFILFIWIITLTNRGSLLKDRILLRIPIFGKIIEQGALSKFNKTFGILIGAGVSLLDSMKLISMFVDNRVFELAVLISTNQIEKGINIEGIGDHGISLGVYFSDPDGNNIEVFYELPKEQWPERDVFSGKFPWRLD